MSIHPDILYAVTRIRTTFVDDVGNVTPGTGTAFWLTTPDGRSLLVTNKHNIDATVRKPRRDDLKLFSIEIEVRRYDDASHPTSETRFFEAALDTVRVSHDTADCVVFPAPRFAKIDDGFRAFGLPVSMLADDVWIANEVNLTDLATFVGFPGRRGKPWWDTGMALPIARLATIASEPRIPFINPEHIETSDVTLVNGFSFSGSSGSPVVIHEKTFETPRGSGRLPRMIIGIMSGHLPDPPEGTPTELAPVVHPMFHSGLSYFTRSQIIIDLVTRALSA